MFKVKYKKDLGPGLYSRKKNILSFSLASKNNELPIIDIGWGFLWCLIKHKLKNRRVYFFATQDLNFTMTRYDFFRIPKPIATKNEKR